MSPPPRAPFSLCCWLSADSLLVITDVFTIEGSELTLEVTSSRRVCENWNHVHGLEPYGDGSYYQQPDGEGNVRHWMLRQNLGGFFLRVKMDGDLTVGDR